MTIDWDRVLATTEEEIDQQSIADGIADLDWSKATKRGVRHRTQARTVVLSPERIVALGEAERLLWLDYDMRGLPEYKAAAEAVHALLSDEVA